MFRFASVVLLLFLLPHAACAPAADWSVRVTPYGRVFPSLERSQARRGALPELRDRVIGNGSGLIGVALTARHDDETIDLVIDGPELGSQRFHARLPHGGGVYELQPPLDWDVDRLRDLRAPRATWLRFMLQRDGVDSGTQQVTIDLRPLDEALYFVREGQDSVDLSFIFAAYVDEHDPVVDRVLDLAQGSGIVSRFTGYADADPDAVYRQAWAVWHALAARAIRYSRVDPAIERGPNVFSQRVRLLADTYNDRSANCIDGSVLIASLLQRIGLRSFLVLVPGHAFVGFYTDADGHGAAYLETTLLGAPTASLRRVPRFAADRTRGAEAAASLASFVAALAAGHAHWTKVAPRLDGRHRPDYAVIDIAVARALGIRPIGIDAGGSARGIAPRR
jgi:hypothetical protein